MRCSNVCPRGHGLECKSTCLRARVTPKPGEFWRHYKGKLVQILSGEAREESEGIEGFFHVVYSEAGADGFFTGLVWIRRLDHFLDEVATLVHDEQNNATTVYVPRFVKLAVDGESSAARKALAHGTTPEDR